MSDGTVDENWAKQHHSLWLEEEKAKGHNAKTTPGRMQPAE
jgi:formate dehydrogenase subunit gamma